MYNYFDNKLNKSSLNIAPGEYYATGEDIIINTVLGSCVSVALYDPVLKIAGLNHFMLAESKYIDHSDGFFKIERYGLYAMESLINSLIKLGGNKNRFQAKVFGGSRVLEGKESMDIGGENIKFAEKFLEAERIPILNHDTGGNRARRIYLFPQSFRILMRRVMPSSELSELMKTYKEKLEKDSEQSGKTVLF